MGKRWSESVEVPMPVMSLTHVKQVTGLLTAVITQFKYQCSDLDRWTGYFGIHIILLSCIMYKDSRTENRIKRGLGMVRSGILTSIIQRFALTTKDVQGEHRPYMNDHYPR